MLFDTKSTLAAQASLDSLWMNTKIITNNLANADTPGFKSQRLSFEAVLSDASSRQTQGSTANPQAAPSENPQTNRYAQASGLSGMYRSRIITDTRSSRIDGSNVSLEREQAELYKTYTQYNYLLDGIKGHYSAISSAISNMRL